MPRKNLRPLPDQLLTLREVAAWLRVHPNTLRHWTNSGRIRTYRVGERRDRRFSAEDVNQFLTGRLPTEKRHTKRGRLLSLQEASLRLGVHPNTLRNWENQGKLKAVRIGSLGERRFSENQIEEYLRDSHTGPGPRMRSRNKASKQSS